jgi:thymidylate synthase
LDSRGLSEYKEGILGPIYGYQWRHFGAPYDPKTGRIASPESPGIDQLQQIIDALKDPNQRSSRRLVLTAWNPLQLDEMALPPCHVLAQFNVTADKLSCALYQRSGDVGLGVPFNIASYSFLTHLLAKHCGLEPKEFVYFLGNAHIYEEHFPALENQITREPYTFPRIKITKKRESIEEYNLGDIVFLEPYVSQPSIQMAMKS